MTSLDTKFSAMTAPQRDYWMGWACGHDWGATSRPYYDTDNELVTFGAAVDRSGVWFEERQVSRTPRDLRDWAGY